MYVPEAHAAQPAAMSDPDLMRLFGRWGRCSKVALRRGLALLPEIIRRGLYKRFAASPYVFANQRLGVSREVVDRVLSLFNRIGDMQPLWDLLRKGEEGWAKLEIAARIASPDNAAWLAGVIRRASKAELTEFVARHLAGTPAARISGATRTDPPTPSGAPRIAPPPALPPTSAPSQDLVSGCGARGHSPESQLAACGPDRLAEAADGPTGKAGCGQVGGKPDVGDRPFGDTLRLAADGPPVKECFGPTGAKRDAAGFPSGDDSPPTGDGLPARACCGPFGAKLDVADLASGDTLPLGGAVPGLGIFADRECRPPERRGVTLFLTREDEDLLRAWQARLQRARREVVSLGDVVALFLRGEISAEAGESGHDSREILKASQPEKLRQALDGAAKVPEVILESPPTESPPPMSLPAMSPRADERHLQIVGAAEQAVATVPSSSSGSLGGGDRSGDSLGAGDRSGDSLGAGDRSGDSLGAGDRSGDSLGAGDRTRDSRLACGEGQYPLRPPRRVEIVVRGAAPETWTRRLVGVVPEGIADAFEADSGPKSLEDYFLEAVEASSKSAGDRIPFAVRKFVALRAGLRCETGDCEEPLHDLDHETPRVEGGDHHPGNVRGRCRLHHRMRHKDLYADSDAGAVAGPSGQPPASRANQAFQAISGKAVAMV